MKKISGTAPLLLLLLLLLLGCGQFAAAKGDILYRNICLCGYRGWERRWIANVTNPPLRPVPPETPSPLTHPYVPAPDPIIDPITGMRVPPPDRVVERQNRARDTIYEDLILAYFLRITFYQRHLESNFTFTRECAPGAACHDYGRKKKRCAKFPLLPREERRTSWHGHRHHRLCYQMRDIPQWDRYWFDKHRREAKVANSPYELASQPEVTADIERECGPECKVRFGMEVIGGKWEWRSTVDKITEEADMCKECA